MPPSIGLDLLGKIVVRQYGRLAPVGTSLSDPQLTEAQHTMGN